MFKKNVQNETTKHLSVGNTKINILALTACFQAKFRLTSSSKQKSSNFF